MVRERWAVWDVNELLLVLERRLVGVVWRPINTVYGKHDLYTDIDNNDMYMYIGVYILILHVHVIYMLSC